MPVYTVHVTKQLEWEYEIMADSPEEAETEGLDRAHLEDPHEEWDLDAEVDEAESEVDE